MDWEAFQEAHFRPHLVIVRAVDFEPQMARVMLGRWLDESFNPPGNCALTRDGQSILVAFENDLDAKKFATLLRATAVASEPMWATMAEGRFDRAARRRIRLHAAGLRPKRDAT